MKEELGVIANKDVAVNRDTVVALTAHHDLGGRG
jgi:hypothetical protein